MVDFTEEERDVIVAALEHLIARYEDFRNNIEAKPLREGAEECLNASWSALQKIKKDVAQTEEVGGAAEKKEDSGCLFIRVPDGIYDQELEKELRDKIPEHSNYPDDKNIFWSKEYSDFVVRGFEEEAEEAVRAHYSGEMTIVKNPEDASKSNVWKIVEKERVETE